MKWRHREPGTLLFLFCEALTIVVCMVLALCVAGAAVKWFFLSP